MMKYNEKVERFPKLGRKNLVNGLSCPPFVYMEDSDNGLTDFAYNECVEHYRPNMKGGHRYNHIYNKCHKYVFRGKNARKIDRNDKKEFVRIFYIGLKLNRNFGEFLHKIFHKNNRSTAQQGKG